MEMKVASQGGQVNLSTVKNPEIKQVSENKDVVEAVSAKDKNYKKEDVIKAIDKLNEFLKDEHTYAEYSVHEKLGDVMVKIINEDTKEVIMECPPKKILDLVAKMMELVGVSIDKKA
ncbi:flagellar protein FlaG [Clostridium sp.]|uniref:flagellar protein FlaG n=1 Tax=Clostridium sp. TaxID=1506 RepID=UPI0025C14AF7|nr:flagellar protein FlaG [Clostridium sp.]